MFLQFAVYFDTGIFAEESKLVLQHSKTLNNCCGTFRSVEISLFNAFAGFPETSILKQACGCLFCASDTDLKIDGEGYSRLSINSCLMAEHICLSFITTNRKLSKMGAG